MAPTFPEPQTVRLVVATRRTKQAFFAETATGQSYKAYRPPNVEMRLFCENDSVGLPKIYNTAIEEARSSPALLVFVHDDVYLPDFFWADRIAEGLRHFDILGVVGSAPRQPLQPSWHLKASGGTFVLRDEGLSGSVAHGTLALPQRVDRRGPARRQVDLLDGLLLAVSSHTLISRDLRFDERFRFHLYDVDFCREAEARSLRCGTWDIAVVHQSAGHYDRVWLEAAKVYFNKWNESHDHLDIFRRV